MRLNGETHCLCCRAGLVSLLAT
uniref:Uncharacterized protein n=1 Tax=Anguilla anguilla TaxID=7936 RepID=A0A0E9UFH3_ANGAN